MIIKRQDLLFIAALMLFFLPFSQSESLFNTYVEFNRNHPFIMSYLKFAVLATLGEVIGLRVSAGVYNQPGFGILPRAIVWGFLGLSIKAAFIIFATGTPALLESLGIAGANEAIQGDFSSIKFIAALTTSITLNIIFGTLLMTLHKITDTHIINNGGTIRGLFTPIKFVEILTNMNWQVMWHFVYKKTIPLFWIPCHTVTFLLPPDVRILFAALLGVALGAILAIASLKK